MSPPTDKKQILEAFRKQIKDGKAIVGAGAGKVAKKSLNQNKETNLPTIKASQLTNSHPQASASQPNSSNKAAATC